jgi:hypothetical protein
MVSSYDELREQHRQMILDVFGINDMSPTERAAWDAYGRAVQAEQADREAFAEHARQQAEEFANNLSNLIKPLTCEYS